MQSSWNHQMLNRQIRHATLLAGFIFCAGAGAAPASWQFGDTHVHDDHSSDGSLWRQLFGQAAPGDLSVAQQIHQAETTGLDFLPLTDHRTYDQHYDPEWTSARLLLIPGEEANGSPHATVQGAVDTIVQGATPPDSPGFRVVQQSIWDAHAQDAVWNTAHPDDGELNDDHTPNDNANAQGIDNIESWNKASNVALEIAYAEDRWNQGFRTGITGASDDHFKQVWSFSGPGMPSTGVYAEPGHARAVLDGLRAGHTVIRGRATAQPTFATATLEAIPTSGDTTKPYLGGDEILAAAGTPFKLRINVQNGFGTTVYLYKSPGRSAGAYATFRPVAPVISMHYDVDVVAEAAPTWYRVEVRGPSVAPLSTSGMDDATYLASSDINGNGSLTDLAPRRHKLHALTPPIFIEPTLVEAQPATPLPADSGTDDGAELALGMQGQFTGFPDLSVVGNAAHLVAETHDGAGHTQVVYRRRNADGSWSSAFNLAPQSSSARFPKVAARGSDVWVVWQDERAGETPHRLAVYLRHSADSGSHWNKEVPVRAVNGRAEHPALALTREGLPLVAWQEITAQTPFDIYAQVIGSDAAPINLSGDGKSFHRADVQDTRSALFPASVWPSVTVADDGRIAIAWQDNRTDRDPLWTGGAAYGNGTNPDNWQIMVRMRGTTTASWNAPTSLGADDLADRHPTITFDSNGQLIAAWDSKTTQSPAGVNLTILAATSPDGITWTAPQAVGQDSNAMSQWPKLGRNASGNAELVWFDSRSSDWRWRIATAQLNSDGSWTPATLIPSLGNNTWPAISDGALAYGSTRSALRMQRDRTQQIFYWGQ